ncbi:hypothetical protein J6590_073336 [Homalodisca vitripennis]|nr:hypothetical protein J6590_073336 [Homalodisca vitripennis]
MSRKNIADNEDLVLQALDLSISSVDNTQSVRLWLGEGDQDTNDQYSESESDLDVFEDSSSQLDDTDADIDYYPSSDNESDSSNTIDHSSPDIDDPDKTNNDDEPAPVVCVDVRLLDPSSDWIEDSMKDHSRVREWLPMTTDKMKAYVITILNMGLVRLPAIHFYWSKRSCAGQAWF